jgi:NAD(P)-dependent dehydrogenase (short-subunit alcohol dehydrogenase family)
MPTVLIVGASRGIGREFARQYAADGARVIATYRKAEDAAPLRALGAKPVALDVTDAHGIAHLAASIAAERIDLAVLNAGVFGPKTNGIAAVSRADFDAVMHTNVWGPMLLIAALKPPIVAARGKLVVLSSDMGSISRMSVPYGWLYRASKSALNSVLKAASLELGPHGVVCMAIHPGWVRTDMGGPKSTLEADASVSAMRRVIAAANDSHNGKFLNYTGEHFDW